MSQKATSNLLDVATEIVIQLQLKTIPHFTTLQKAAARISEGMLQLADSLELYHIVPYLLELMLQDLKLNMPHPTIRIDAISGMYLLKC